MNDSVNTATSVLLPAATVDFFLKDKETAEAARSLSDDWRFARVTVSVEEGNIESAIQAYEQAASPSLIIIETDTTDSSFVDRLGALSAHCDEGTAAIIIGPVNDVNLYRQLTSMGVSDYLVRPVPFDTLSEVVAGTLIEQIGASDSRLIGVVGAKGGVGATSMAQALALGISENLGQKTFMMDASGGWGSLSVGLGFEPLAKISEATRVAGNHDIDSLKRLLVKPNDKLCVLASGSDPMLERVAEPQEFEALIDLIMASYPMTVIDLSGAQPELKKTVIERAHELLLVTTPTLPSLRAARTLMHEIKVLHGGAMHGIELVLNMRGMVPGKEVPESDIKAALDHHISVSIDYDPKIFMSAEGEGKHISQIKGGEAVVNALLPLGQKMTNGKSVDGNIKSDNKSDGLLGQVLNKFKA